MDNMDKKAQLKLPKKKKKKATLELSCFLMLCFAMAA